MQQVGDVGLGVLVLGAPEQRLERADLDADAAVHAQREVDVEAVEGVLLAGLAALAAGRGEVLVGLDVDAPVGALAGAEHARGAVLLVEGDDATGPGRRVFLDVGVVDGDRAAAHAVGLEGLDHLAEGHAEALEEALAGDVGHQNATFRTAVTRMFTSEIGMSNFQAKAWS